MGLAKQAKRTRAYVQDHPRVVTLTVYGLVVVHVSLTLVGVLGNPWQSLIDSMGSQPAVTIYLGLATVSSLVASAAGMVITLGLASRGEQLTTFRASTNEVLKPIWTSILSSALTAAGCGLIAALLAGIRAGFISPWLFELGVMLLAHGAIRMVWLLRVMMGVVRQEDIDKSRRPKLTVSQILAKKSA